MSYLMIFITCASKKEAQGITESLLKKRLVPCVNMVPGVISRFWWKGRIDAAKESLLILKTRKKNFTAIEKEIKRIHSYEVPEIIAVPIVRGNKAYLEWIDESLRCD